MDRARAHDDTSSLYVRRLKARTDQIKAIVCRLVLPCEQPNIASGERVRAERVASATDPPNLIWVMPAKEAGRT